MRIEIRNDSVIIDGYVNAVARDSKPLSDGGGKKFFEQIMPGTFQRALDKGGEVRLLLNHEADRLLGSTESNLRLHEDSIGLRAHAVITDPDVMEKARNKRLRGWSFGFYDLNSTEEELPNGMYRRFVDDIELVEVSIIDDQKIPAYDGTSIEARALEEKMIRSLDVLEVEMEYENRTEPVGLTRYHERIKELEAKL